MCAGCDWSSLCSDPLVKEDCKCFVVIVACDLLLSTVSFWSFSAQAGVANQLLLICLNHVCHVKRTCM